MFYLGQTRDHRIHIGGGPVDYVFNNGLRQPNNAETRYAALHAELTRIFPALAAEPLELQWGGLVDMSLDQSPPSAAWERTITFFMRSVFPDME